MEEYSLNKSKREMILLEIRREISNNIKGFTEDELEVLVNNIFESAFLYVKNIKAKDINTYIIIKNLVLSYSDNFEPKTSNFDLDIKFLHDIVLKTINRIQEVM